jgi:ABC-type lipoprotein export system ATPase subunit
VVLRDLDLSIEEGDLRADGTVGSGKTTLLNLIGAHQTWPAASRWPVSSSRS